MNKRNALLECCKCGTKMARDILAEHVASTDQEYQRPIYSDAAGVHPDQVPEHRRRFPDVPITDDGRVIFESHSKRKKHLKRVGLFDRDGYD